MVRLFVLLFTLLALNGGAATYYVAPVTASPAGNDANSGDKLHPWASWEKAFTSRLPGDTVIFRGGVYPTTVTNGSGITKTINGTAAKWVVFMNYHGEKPILDCSKVTSTYYGTNYGMRLSGSYYILKGLTIRNVWQINAVEPAELCYAFRTTGNDFTLENCTAHSTHGSGFWPHGTNVNIINCDSYDHCDSRTLDGHMPGNNGYGYFHYNTGTTGSIYYKECRAWDCGDDGWALADNSYVEIDGCWSFRNGRLEGGGNGFKIGFIPQASSIPLLRVVKNSIAAFNRASGLTTNDNNNYTIAPANIYNNVAYHNGYYPEWKNSVYGFYLYNTTGTDAQELQRLFRNNISYANQTSPVGDGYYHDVLYTHSHNSWDISGLTVSDADFLSVDSTGISGPRQADGSLPALNFLKLAPASKLIDRGVDVGIPYTGNAPDLGIAEQVTTLLPPVAAITAPATTVLTCATSSIILTATGGVSYSWSDGSKVVGTSASLTVTQAATYTVTVTSAGGLTATASITITEEKTPPVVTITNNSGTTILDAVTTAISITAAGGIAYSWSDGLKVIATTATLTSTSPATYTVTVTGGNGCIATKAITITRQTEVLAAPVVSITQPECGDTGGTIRVTDPAPGTGYTYSINGSDYSNTTGLFTGVAAGIFQVTVRNSAGTISPATVVTVNPISEGNIVPLFDIFGPYPEGSEPVPLPRLSNNGITGSWSPAAILTTLPGNFTFIFSPDAGQCAVSTQISVDILKAEVAGTPQFTRQISSGSDDVEERSTGTVVPNSNDLELVYDNYTTGNQVIGLRFNNITIPAGATVTRAYIQFTVAETTYGTTQLRVYGHKTDHALPFTTARKNVSRRPRTSASVPWAPAPLGGSAVGSRTETQQTADLSPILQEILNRTGWTPGNSMAFIITGYGKRNALAYEGSRSEAAELVVEYTLPATAVTAVATTATTALPINTLALGTGILRGEISCYPVPFREILHIRYQPGAGEEASMMGLFDLTGKLLKTLDHRSPLQNITTGDLPPGMYLLRVDTNTGGIVQKVVKQ